MNNGKKVRIVDVVRSQKPLMSADLIAVRIEKTGSYYIAKSLKDVGATGKVLNEWHFKSFLIEAVRPLIFSDEYIDLEREHTLFSSSYERHLMSRFERRE